jgi:hypothetical protein
MNKMRRVWLPVLTAFALAASGISSAVAIEACPMQQAMAVEAQHDCCPDQRGDKNQPLEQHDMNDCVMGVACRAAPAVAPTFAPIALPDATIRLAPPIVREPANLSGPLRQLFRPPRTI